MSNKLGTVVYTHDFGHKVYAVLMGDRSSKRLSVDIFVEYGDGSLSDVVTIPRKDIFGKKTFDFLKDMYGSFGEDEIASVKNGVAQIIKDDTMAQTVQSKATMDEIHQSVSSYILENAEELEDNADAPVFIKGDYGYISFEKLEEFVKDNSLIGYKRLEILKRLKIMGVLKPGKERPYDTMVNIGGNRKRFYKVELAKVCTEEKEDEVIECGDKTV